MKGTARERAKGGADFAEKPPIEQQHITTDTTVEALADVLRGNPKGLLVYRDEATGWVASLNQYKGGKGSDKQFWLSAWSSQNYTVNRKGQPPVKIVKPFVSVIGNIPPDMLGELADRQGREDGFIDRVLFAYPDEVPGKWTDSYPDPELEKRYIDACLSLIALPPAVLTLSSGAQLQFKVWYDEHNRHKDGPAGAWAKMDGYCARLANIVHHLRFAYGEIENRDEVDADDIKKAIALIDYFKNHVRRALGCMKAHKQSSILARVMAFVCSSEGYCVRPRNLVSQHLAKDVEEGKALLSRLVRMRLGTVVKGRRADEFIFKGHEDLEKRVATFDEPGKACST